MKKSLSWRKICSILLSVAVLLYLFYQMYSVSRNTIQTEYALDYTYHETVPLNGFIIRKEVTLSSSEQGIIGYAQANGSKVPAGQVVARVFENDEQAAVQAELDEVNELIDDLSSLQNDDTQQTVNVEGLDNRIDQTINRYLTVTERCETEGSDVVSKELLRLLNKKQITLGSGGDIKQYISSLQAKKAALEASVKHSAVVTAPESGYFISQVDGCETVVSFEETEDLSVSSLQKAMEHAAENKSGAGKVITNNEWYLAAVVNLSLAQQLTLDSVVTITIPVLSEIEYQCTVTALNVDTPSNTVALVLKCGQINTEILNVRKVEAQLRTNSYHGLRVRSDSIRVVDGITGVYIVDGISSVFKPVETLYTDANITICKYDTTKEKYLKIYDEVIVEGSGLYDGKVIR